MPTNTSIFKPLVRKTHLARNLFDLSYRNLFNAPVGALLPCFVKDVNPNESFVITPNIFTRTQTLNTAAFARMKQNVDFFFVPYRLLNSQFGNFFSATKYPSNFVDFAAQSKNSQGVSQMPYLDLIHLYKSLLSFKDSTVTQDVVGWSKAKGALRLLDLLGYGSPSSFTDQPAENEHFNVNPFRLQAYQKVYNDFFRLPLYEPIKPQSWNTDAKSYIYASGDGSLPKPTLELKFGGFGTSAATFQDQTCDDFLILHYANWKKDYYTSIRPSYEAAEWTTSNQNIAPLLPHVTTFNSDVSVSVGATRSGQSLTAGLDVSPNDSEFSIPINSLRAAYALDKLTRSTIYAKNGSYAEQVAARFGVRPIDNSSSTYLGSIDSPIQISEVTSTSDTLSVSSSSVSGSQLGDIAGQGSSYTRGQIKFESKEHGIILGIYSCVPEADYQSTKIDRMNTCLQRGDYFQPEFADLGQQPTYLYEFGTSFNTASQRKLLDNVIGYNYRYAQYKTSIDEVHGELVNNRTQQSWVAPRGASDAFVMNTANGVPLKELKVNPAIVNPIFAIAYDGTQKTDQLLVNAFFDVKAFRPMSVYGVPNL